MSEHIKVRYQWVRYVLNEKELFLEKVHTYDNEFNMWTKILLRSNNEDYFMKDILSFVIASSY